MKGKLSCLMDRALYAMIASMKSKTIWIALMTLWLKENFSRFIKTFVLLLWLSLQVQPVPNHAFRITFETFVISYFKFYLTGKSSSHWLSPEILSMFLFHSLRPMSMAEEVAILEALVKDKLPLAMQPIMKLAQQLRTSNDPTLASLASSFSTRQLLRLTKRLKVSGNSNRNLNRCQLLF